jgi:UPF0716 protein FxsA
MFLIVLALILLWPVVELVVAISVARELGGPLTLVALVVISVFGALLSKRSGVSVWRRANAEMAAGRPPTRQVLDGALILVGGIALMLPGFVSGAFGALLMLPPVRALLRPLLMGWMGARAARAARSGRLGGVVVDTVIGDDGRVRQRTRRFGEVIDSEGWEVEPEPDELPPGVIDVDGHPEEER